MRPGRKRPMCDGRLRDELLNETLFASLAHVREALAIWKDDYNTVRPHSGLKIYRQPSMPKSALPECNGTERCATSRDPRPVPLHHRANRAQMKPGLSSAADETRGAAHRRRTRRRGKMARVR
jgi:hypothetical protein